MPVSRFTRAALAGAERGWAVFPLRPDDKRPAIRDWEARATTDPDRIARCWSAGPYNIGIATGPAGLVVVDCDTPKPGAPVPAEWADQPGVVTGEDVLATLAENAGQTAATFATFTVRTGSGGIHLYYQTPPGDPVRNTAGTLGWLIDTRATGGYVVGPGSVVAGHRYTIAADGPTAALPTWITTRLTTGPPPARPAVAVPSGTDRQARYLRVAIDRELYRVTSAKEGTRNHCLFLAATALGQLIAGDALDPTDVTGWLTDAANRAGLDPTEIESTIRSGLRVGARRPRGVAA